MTLQLINIHAIKTNVVTALLDLKKDKRNIPIKEVGIPNKTYIQATPSAASFLTSEKAYNAKVITTTSTLNRMPVTVYSNTDPVQWGNNFFVITFAIKAKNTITIKGNKVKITSI